MAIKKSEIKKRVQEEPLSAEHLRVISDTELYIDKEIEKAFDRDGEFAKVRIELGYFNFDWDSAGRPLPYSSTTRKKMRNELEAIFKNAGWDMELEDDDYEDVGSDYIILS